MDLLKKSKIDKLHELLDAALVGGYVLVVIAFAFLIVSFSWWLVH